MSSHDELSREAHAARENAIAPFSHFRVGAALRASSGRVYRGCNVENSTLGLTVCAERVALLTALAAGERSFDAIVVVSQSEEPAPPCGPCRQLLWEFARDVEVTMESTSGRVRRMRLSELFPHPFDLNPEA